VRLGVVGFSSFARPYEGVVWRSRRRVETSEVFETSDVWASGREYPHDREHREVGVVIVFASDWQTARGEDEDPSEVGVEP
jgi:hypothetical protein